MTNDDTVTGDETEREPLRLLRRFWHVWVPCALALLAVVFYAGALGFRGFGPEIVELLQGSKGSSPQHLKTLHPGFELLGAILGGDSASAYGALRLLSCLLVAGSLPAIWGLGRKLGDWRTATVASVVFAALPQIAGIATSISVGALFIFTWSWFLRLLVVDRHAWYSTLLLWLLGALLFLTWPVFPLWLVLWLYLELRHSTVDARSPDVLDGELPPAAIPLAVLVAPIAVFVLATAMHPGFWADPAQGWKLFMQHAMSTSGPVFSFAGTTYEHARPPIWTGLRLLWWYLPAFVVVAMGIGWARLIGDRRATGRSGTLLRQMFLWGVPLVCALPWLHRGPSYGEIEFTFVLAPFVAVLSGDVLAAGVRSIAGFTRQNLMPSGGVVAGAAFATIFLGMLVLITVRAHPVEGSYYSHYAGGFKGAVETGLEVSRDGVYPIPVLKRARQRMGAAKMRAVGGGDLLKSYSKAGFIPRGGGSGDISKADGLVRRLEAFQPGSKSTRTNPDAMVSVTAGASPLLRIDGIPVFWLERHTTP